MEIIHNLYNISRNKNQEIKGKTVLLFITLILFYSSSFCQDNIPVAIPIDEKKNIEFQELFFKALSEKAINNHQKAIDYLEKCHQLIPNNTAVLFELSKNYLKLRKPIEAVVYGNQALIKEADNLWILEHIVTVYKTAKNYTKAIEFQEKIIKNHPKKKQNLVFLHLQNKNILAAKKTLEELKNAKLLNPRLRRIQQSLQKNNKTTTNKVVHSSLENTDLKILFKKKKSFQTLKKLLQQLDVSNSTELLQYSEQGMTIFPAQPLVYFMNGKALNKQKQFKKAIESLKNGIDFVIDNPTMENNFYKELVNAYQNLGDFKNADKYRKKIK